MLELLLSRAVGTVYTDKCGLTTDQWRVLAAVAVWGPIEPSQVSRWATVDKASVSRAVAALVEKAFISRASHTLDRRKQVLSLTPSGHRTFTLVVKSIHEIQERLFEVYGRAEQMAFFRVRDTLEERLRQMLGNGK